MIILSSSDQKLYDFHKYVQYTVQLGIVGLIVILFNILFIFKLDIQR